MKQKGKVFTGSLADVYLWGNQKRFLHVLMIGCPAHNFVTCKELVRPVQVF